MSSPLAWLVPAFLALFLYGTAQGLVKKYITDISPARFCLFFIVARSLVFLGWFLIHDHPPVFAPEGRAFLLTGVAVYLLDGLGWILYYKSIVLGPISIVGTLSAAYPAPTILFARLFLGEALTPMQYLGVTAIILACLGLSYEPASPGEASPKKRGWVPLALAALLMWGAAQTLLKYAYRLGGANDANMSLFAVFGGFATLGVYGLLYGRRAAGGITSTGMSSAQEWARSFVPMAIMAGGDLGVIIATMTGPVSIVTPLTGAYPVVTVPFAAYLLKERVTKLQLACILAVVAGAWLAV